MSKLLILPRTIGIELVRGCNFKCLMCPVTCNAFSEPNKFQFMSLDLLEKMAAEIDRWPTIETIWFFHFGEPLAHPQYRQCLEILHHSAVARKANVIQHTNASLLEGDKAEAILDIPVIKQLTVSFDGFGDKVSYERLRGPHFDVVLKNIRQFVSRARTCRPDLRLTTCSILPREGEVPDLTVPSREVAFRQLFELFQPLGIEVQTRDMHDYSGNDKLTISGTPPPIIAGGCNFVEQDSLYFTVSGRAQPCCSVYDESFNVGYFPTRSFAELLNCEKMQRLRHRLRLDERHELPLCRECSLSLAVMGEQGMRDRWAKVDAQGEIDDLSERRHIWGKVIPTPNKVVRLDLGCGRRKLSGFIGVDHYRHPGVNVVLDLDQPLPFADDSVDLVLASNSLEHVNNLEFTMQEIYRVCRHGAQLCIISTYSNEELKVSNPPHKQVFNEHTPRFWTSSTNSAIDVDEYMHLYAKTWGLRKSKLMHPDIDFRCMKMDFFYFPEYQHLSEKEQRNARKSYWVNVCDEIMYHLMVVKEPISEQELKQLAKSVEYYDPPYVTVRRLQRHCAVLEMEVGEMRGTSAIREAELEQANIEIGRFRIKGKAIVHELDLFRNRKLTRWFNQFFEKSNLWNDILPSFQQLKDDSLMLNKGLKGYRLQPSLNLQRVSFLYYPLDLNRPDLRGILLASILDLPLTRGELGVEIVSPSNTIVAQRALPVNQIDESVPVRFDFAPIKHSDHGRFWLRVFAREIDTPVRIFELRKYSAFGLGPLQARAFCGLLFENAQR
ncbi:MAG: hypothetical protein A2V86_05685 [Deltaproteobacteria bacterium RBG_16_49_23]|nr:MAG: hypothetical protein A2V86_05685 [Deltaproteobacteria bacterium RBG_16_49_23]